MSLIFFYINSIVRPPHYKDHFSSYEVVVLIAEFYCTYHRRKQNELIMFTV